jgi:tetratricopeptide (TPR) repeat protein
MKIFVILMALLVLAVMIVPCAADGSQESFQAAGKLYSDSVDLANAGKYQEALDAADKALALNVTSLTGVIQSNRAGILVTQKRYDDAITAADAALAVEGNLTTVHSIAWYNKGNALRALGRISEARDAYAKAYALDNTLVPPDLSADVPGVPVSSTHSIPVSPTPKSPLSAGLVLAAFGGVACMGSVLGKK